MPVHRVSDSPRSGRTSPARWRSSRSSAPARSGSEALRIAEAFRARVIDATVENFVFELTGNTDKLDAFLDLMRPLGLAEVSRTGVAAIARGPRTIDAGTHAHGI